MGLALHAPTSRTFPGAKPSQGHENATDHRARMSHPMRTHVDDRNANARPTHVLLELMTAIHGQQRIETRQALVKQVAHRPEGSCSQIKGSERLFLRNRRELIEKLLDRFASFQVVEERMDRNSRAAEYRSASGNLRIAVYARAWFDPHGTMKWHRSRRSTRPPDVLRQAAFRTVTARSDATCRAMAGQPAWRLERRLVQLHSVNLTG